MRTCSLGRMVTATIATAMLAGCAAGGSASGGRGATSRAVLTVHIGLFGGPARPDGGMMLSNSPASNENVTVIDSVGRKEVGRTGVDGIATMTLPPGRYTVFSTYCGIGRHDVVLTAGRPARVQIECPVP